MKQLFQKALWLFLLPAILVAGVAALLNLLTLNGLDDAQGQRITRSTQQLALVAETTSLVESIGRVHDEVDSLLDRASRHELDEAGAYRVHSRVVNELAVLAQRVRALESRAAEFTSKADVVAALGAEFNAYRDATVMTTDIAAIDPGRARQYIDQAEHRFFRVSRQGHQLSQRLAETALEDVTVARQEMNRTFWRVMLVGLAGLAAMLGLSLMSARYLSRQLSVVLNSLNALAHSPARAFDAETLAELEANRVGALGPMTDAVLRFADEIRQHRQAQEALAMQHQALVTSEANASTQRHFLGALIQTIPDLVWLKDTKGVYLFCNPRFEQLYGKSQAEIVGKTDYDFVSKELADFFRANDQAALNAKGPRVNEEELVFAADGHKEWVLTIKTPMVDAEGAVIGVLGIGRDMSALKQAEEAMQASLDQLNEAQRIAKLGSWTLDLRSNRLDWSDEIFRIFEIDPTKFGASYEAFLNAIHPDDREAVNAAYSDSLKTRQPYEITHRLLMADGRVKHVQERCETVFGSDGTPLVSHGTVQDVSAHMEAEARIHRLAYYDALTGLPNRALLADRLAQTLAAGRRQQRKETLILLNIDRFKNINDARGMALGDRLLQALAQRLGGLTREGDTLARLSGDEFALLLPDMALHPSQGGRQALAVAEKIHAALRNSFAIAGEEVLVTASLGITMFPETGDETPEVVLRRADTALHRAKDAGGNRSAFFETGMGEAAQQRFAIEGELRRGIAAGELRLYLQAQVDARGRLAGAEVLVRWQHPERGLLPPGVFIPIAEESDLIVDLGVWVMTESCRLLAREDMAGNGLHLSVNLSPRHFRQPGFVAWVRELLAATGADPTRLTLEVTEGLVIDNIGDVVSKMSELATLGIHFSVDDFGTGYSSLAQLLRMPVSLLKIDREFIAGLGTRRESRIVTSTVVGMGKSLGLKLVAEGVETAAQLAQLRQFGCDYIQGYFFHRPMEETRFFEVVTADPAGGAATEELCFLLYVSEATQAMDAAALEALLEQSRRFNGAAGITGFLIYQDGWFMQLLEGREAVLDALMERIRQDPRHHKVQEVARGKLSHRSFPDWSMGFRNMEQLPGNPTFESYDQWRGHTLGLLEMSADAQACYSFITAFSESR